MSRTATATPPPTYFPQKPNTPSLRHAAVPNVTAAHFKANHAQGFKQRRRFKHLPTSLTSLHAKKPDVDVDVPFEDVPLFDEQHDATSNGVHPISRRGSTVSDGAPSMTASFADSFDSTASTSLPTPTDTEDSFVVQQNLPTQYPSLFDNVPSFQRSWVPNFRGMAKAVTTTFNFDKKKAESPIVTAPVFETPRRVPKVPAAEIYCPSARIQSVPEDALVDLSPDDRALKEREWMEAEHKRIADCAALCSQWPRSGYNVAKFGPHGKSPNLMN